jgi:hypothetical protein
VNEKELLFLDAWLKSQQYLANHDDVVGILQQVGEFSRMESSRQRNWLACRVPSKY